MNEKWQNDKNKKVGYVGADDHDVIWLDIHVNDVPAVKVIEPYTERRMRHHGMLHREFKKKKNPQWCPSQMLKEVESIFHHPDPVTQSFQDKQSEASVHPFSTRIAATDEGHQEGNIPW